MSLEEVFGCNGFEYLLSLLARLSYYLVDDIINAPPPPL